jgi:hypothetical protein
LTGTAYRMARYDSIGVCSTCSETRKIFILGRSICRRCYNRENAPARRADRRRYYRRHRKEEQAKNRAYYHANIELCRAQQKKYREQQKANKGRYVSRALHGAELIRPPVSGWGWAVKRSNGDGARPATCHPDRAHHSAGLCMPCYSRDYHARVRKPRKARKPFEMRERSRLLTEWRTNG